MVQSPITSISALAERRQQLESEGKKLVLTNGVFDILHVGHVRYLNEAAGLGDELVVAINADDSVRELKGSGRPIHTAEERAEILLSLRSVDHVVVFAEQRATRVIESIRPHVYTKGGDYTPESLIDEERELLHRLGTEIRILSLVPGKSSSAILAAERPQGGRKKRLAILGSGKGSNALNIIRAVQNGTLDAEVSLVCSDVADSGILRHAREHGISAIFVDPGSTKRGHLTDAAIKEIHDRCQAADIDLIVLAGFMRVVREPLLSRWPDRILNIHPSLLPKYPGLNTIQKAMDAGDTHAGCTVHLVDAGIDTGRILAQEKVAILPGDTVASLTARVQEAEHRVLPAAIAERLAAC